MRHRKRGRRLGRSTSHRRAMLRNLASSLFLTEREDVEFDDNAPAVKGRVVTTMQKAKEVRPLVEKCITLARRSLPHAEAAQEFESSDDRGSDRWKSWRSSDDWQKWCSARAPVVAARRRALQLLGDKEAVEILFDQVAPRFVDRDGGYTRILRLAKPRVGDAGTRAILEFVGVRDRETLVSERPAFSDTDSDEATSTDAATGESEVTEDTSSPSSEQASEESAMSEESDAAASADDQTSGDAEPESEDKPKDS